MIRDSLSGELIGIDDASPAATSRREPACSRCGYGHGAGRACLVAREAAPGECSDVVPIPKAKKARAAFGHWRAPEERTLKLCRCRRWFLMLPRQRLCLDCQVAGKRQVHTPRRAR